MPSILIVNQHGSNRGDEAACRGMIYGLRQCVPECKIDVLCVYPINLSGIENVKTYENVRLRGISYKRFLLRVARLFIQVKCGFWFTSEEKEVAPIYQRADLVISAPGGLYIGDSYRYTEAEMLYHILWAFFSKKQVMIYAPSMGPFNSRLRNILRAWILKRVNCITLREKVSQGLVAGLGIAVNDENVTADSALQMPVDRALGSSLMQEMGFSESKRYVGFVPLELERFADDKQKVTYIHMCICLLRKLVREKKYDIVCYPQGYAAWMDLDFIEKLLEMADVNPNAYILPVSMNSNEQQAMIGQMDGFITFRYHPGIFALRQLVPTVTIAYEHKTIGFMESIGMIDYCLRLEDATVNSIMEKFNMILSDSIGNKSRLQERIHAIEKRAFKNSQLAAQLIDGAR